MPKDNKKTRPCTCAFSQQLHCTRFKEGECNEKPIPGTFGDPNARYGHIRRPAPVAKKTKPPRTRDDGPT
jgi:hypothetical protein